MIVLPDNPFQKNQSSTQNLREWRARILDGVLRGIFLIWLFALASGINNVIQTYKQERELYENPLLMAASLIAVYVGATVLLAAITFLRKLRYEIRAALLLFILYLVGAVGLLLSSLSGDGRIFLFAFIILAAVLFDLRASLAALTISALTLSLVGWLEVSEVIVVPAQRQINANDPNAWVSGGIVFCVLSVAILISVAFILRALEQLYEQSQTKASEMERLYAASRDMSASLMDTPALLQALARHMAEAVKATSANIMFIDLDIATFSVLAEFWAAEASEKERVSDAGRTYPISDFPNIINALLAGQVIIQHYDDANLADAEKKQFSTYNVKSMFFVPIMAHGKLIGDAELWESRSRREFTQAEINLVQAIASQAGSIIENSKLFAETRKREGELAALLDVAQAVSSSLDLPDVLEKAATLMARTLRVDFCSLSDYFPEHNCIYTTAIYSANGNVSGPGDVGHYFPLTEYPATAKVLESGTPLIVHVDDADADPAEIGQLHHDSMVVSLLVPLMVHGQSLGLAELFSSDKNREFKPQEIQLARALADQVAVAIEKARLYETMERRESYFRALFENSAEGVAVLDVNGAFVYITQAEERILGYVPADVIGNYAFDIAHPDDRARAESVFAECIKKPGKLMLVEYRAMHADGAWRHIEVSLINLLDNPSVEGVVANFRDITERKNAEQAIRESQVRLEGIVNTVMNAIITVNSEQRIVIFNPAAERIFGYSAKDVIGQHLDILIPAKFRNNHSRMVEEFGKTGFTHRINGQLSTLFGLRSNGQEFPLEAFVAQTIIQGELYFTVVIQDITERKQAEEALMASEMKFRALAENIPSVVFQCQNDDRYTFIYLNDAIEDLTGYPKSRFLENGLSFFDLYHPDDAKKIPIPSDGGNINNSQFHITYRIRHRSGEWRWVDEWGTGVLDDSGGVLYIEGIMVDITDRKRVEDEVRQRSAELESLVEVSGALRQASNRSDMLSILLHRAVKVSGGMLASIYLLEPETGDLVSSGWYSRDDSEIDKLLVETVLRHHPGEGVTGRVFQTGDVYEVRDLTNDPYVIVLPDEAERLKNIWGGISLPLRANENVIGVLHVWLAEHRSFTNSEIRLLTALAEIAGNSLHRATLHEQTLNHADELAHAYDNTLVGWARALELRDELTEGHTRRVTEITVKLARRIGLPESEIIHIRRGAILHDIGKMAVPDAILHKTGSLNQIELEIIRLHPQHAYDMLSSIPFLQAALDIPYCHHEHWDGTGYPRGLKGEEIPFAARIFSVADVWDALTSDRPYRKAWAKEKTVEYIIENSGKYFDPRVVEIFLGMIPQL